MIRLSACALLLQCILSPASAQTAPSPNATSSAQHTTPRKPTSKPKAAAETAQPASAGRCGVGVITAVQDLFAVQKIGLTVFGNDYAEVPVSWRLDDLAFARVRTAAGPVPVRRIAYAKGAFDSYYHPQGGGLRNRREELSNLIRQIAGGSGCERYLVVMRSGGQFPGTNQWLTGLGVVNRGAGIINYSYLFAYVGVIVLDGQTFEIKRDPNANFEGVMKHIADNLVTNENLRKVDNSAFPTAAAESASSTILRDDTRRFLSEKLDKILPAFFKQ